MTARTEGAIAQLVPTVAILASSVVAGCTGANHAPPPDAQAVERPDPRTAVCASADAAGETAAPPFEVIQQIFDSECVSCHTHGADLDLSSGLAWGDLVGVPAPVTESCGGTLVVADDPDASYLVQKISSNQPCSGMRMPRTEFAPAPLPDCVIALVRNWIATGATGPAGADGGGD
jgi:hypothetical protein